MNKNRITIIVSIVFTLVLLLGGTYAAWNFLTEKTSVTMLVGGDQISFDAGEDITVTGILPVYSMEDGITKDIEIYKENGDYTAGIDLYLNLKTWPPVMSSPSFRWTLYKNGNYLSSGDFSNTSQGNNIKLTSNTQSINLIDNKDNYTLYIWIDAHQESNINMMNKSFTVNLYGQVSFYNDYDPIANDTVPNRPELADGMIPIKYNYVIDEWVKADETNTDNDWYDYYNKMWANAVMVTSDSRDKYMNANVGTTVSENDILAYYVWVPRYRYLLFNTGFESIEPREIQIEFQSITDEISNGTKNDEYLTHPAFWWDNDSDGIREEGEELSGIWVGKFEMSDVSIMPTIKPNQPSVKSLDYYNFFYLCKEFETTTYLTETGINEIDAHMIKNIEWGAVVYLSHSKYGINKEISYNDSTLSGRKDNYTYNDFIITDGNITPSKETGTGVLTSTTGNVYGVYDMSGGFLEAVMGFIKTEANSIDYASTGFNQNNMIESKYYDLYEYGTNASDYSRSKLGDATGETRKWYADTGIFIIKERVFVRSGYPSMSGKLQSGAFAFGNTPGKSYNTNNSTTRSVVIFD